MKILIEHEVSDDPTYCDKCVCKEGDYCNLFDVYELSLSYGKSGYRFMKCKECLSASKGNICACNSKKAPLSDSTGKVCQCTCK